MFVRNILALISVAIILNSVGGVECQVVGTVFHGDHSLFVGEVKSAFLHNDVESLNLNSTGWNYGG